MVESDFDLEDSTALSEQNGARNPNVDTDDVDISLASSTKEELARGLSTPATTLTIEWDCDDRSLGDLSDLSHGNISYIADLATQKNTRTERLEKEAHARAFVLYKLAQKEGHGGIGFFLTLVQECKRRLLVSKAEHYRLQDTRLDEALDDELRRREEISKPSTLSSLYEEGISRRGFLVEDSTECDDQVEGCSKMMTIEELNGASDYDWGDVSDGEMSNNCDERNIVEDAGSISLRLLQRRTNEENLSNEKNNLEKSQESNDLVGKSSTLKKKKKKDEKKKKKKKKDKKEESSIPKDEQKRRKRDADELSHDDVTKPTTVQKSEKHKEDKIRKKKSKKKEADSSERVRDRLSDSMLMSPTSVDSFTTSKTNSENRRRMGSIVDGESVTFPTLQVREKKKKKKKKSSKVSKTEKEHRRKSKKGQRSNSTFDTSRASIDTTDHSTRVTRRYHDEDPPTETSSTKNSQEIDNFDETTSRTTKTRISLRKRIKSFFLFWKARRAGTTRPNQSTTIASEPTSN